MASLNGNLGAATLTGNIGLQAVHTDVSSSSLNFPTVKDKYWMWLPSAQPQPALGKRLRHPAGGVQGIYAAALARPEQRDHQQRPEYDVQPRDLYRQRRQSTAPPV